MKPWVKIAAVLSVAAAITTAQTLDSNSYSLGATSLKAGFSIGFNYDMLRPPTDVSTEYAKGYFGLNIPIQKKFDQIISDNIFANPDIVGDTSFGNKVQPQISAQQNANSTFRVDVPMFGGVATFANIQNFYMYYNTTLGNPNISLTPDLGTGLGLLMRGSVNVPIDLAMGWETMSLGYAYRFNRWIMAAFNLQRNIFQFNAQAQINIDLLGYLEINQEVLNARIPIDYPSTKVNGSAVAAYTAEAWSTAVGLDIWRFTLTSRFGLKTKSVGELNGTYRLPFFVNPETFEISLDFNDPAALMSGETKTKFMNGATDSLTWTSEDNLEWTMPSAYSVSFDLIPDKLNISYTKIVGDIEMKLGGIRKIFITTDSLGNEVLESDTVNFNWAATVDNVILLSGNWRNAFFNLGVSSLDLRWGDKANILSDAIPIDQLKLGSGMMIPVLNFGAEFGTKLQLLLELDVLPLIALKSGIIYYF